MAYNEDPWEVYRRAARETPPEKEQPRSAAPPSDKPMNIWEATSGPFREIYLPASDFAGIPDAVDRAYELYWAHRRGTIDLHSDDIRALVAELVGTFHGDLLDELIHPKARPVQLKPHRAKKMRPQHKRPLPTLTPADFFADED